jgi:hypothetical protein
MGEVDCSLKQGTVPRVFVNFINPFIGLPLAKGIGGVEDHRIPSGLLSRPVEELATKLVPFHETVENTLPVTCVSIHVIPASGLYIREAPAARITEPFVVMALILVDKAKAAAEGTHTFPSWLIANDAVPFPPVTPIIHLPFVYKIDVAEPALIMRFPVLDGIQFSPSMLYATELVPDPAATHSELAYCILVMVCVIRFDRLPLCVQVIPSLLFTQNVEVVEYPTATQIPFHAAAVAYPFPKISFAEEEAVHVIPFLLYKIGVCVPPRASTVLPFEANPLKVSWDTFAGVHRMPS